MMAIQIEQNISHENAKFLRDAFNISYGSLSHDSIKTISEWLDNLVKAADIRENKKRQRHFRVKFSDNRSAVKSSTVRTYTIAARSDDYVIFAETKEILNNLIEKEKAYWKGINTDRDMSEWEFAETQIISGNQAHKTIRPLYDRTPGPYTPRKAK